MDQEAIENELNCSICLDTYTDPKILQCFHVFCQTCLVKLVVQDQQGQLSLSCPFCCQVTPVPASGTAGLQSAFHINRLLEILDQHKKAKPKSASAERADSKAESLSPSALYCSEHSRKEVELYCETCRKLICSMCAIKMGKHHSHDYMLIDESIERFRAEVTPYIKQMEKKMATGIEVLARLDKQCKVIAAQQVSIEADIRDSSKRLHEIIEKRENELIGQLGQITSRKLKSLSAKKDEIGTLQAQLSSCLEFTRENVKTGIEQPEILTMKRDIIKQVHKVVTAPEPDILTISAGSDTLFSGSADAAAVYESYGRVFTPNSLKHVSSAGQETEEVVVGEKAIAILYAVGCAGEPCQNVSAEVVSEQTQCPAECSVEPRGEGRYVISYQPTVKGRHQLHIKADGQHIRGSPFNVAVKLPVEKLGTPIKVLRNVRNPWGVVVTGKGDVVVTEWGQHCVFVFSPSGEKKSFGKCPGEFQQPSGVAVDRKGNILVADSGSHRIQKFTADGRFLNVEELQFKPSHIAYNSINNMVYVVDQTNSCIQVMSSDLVLKRTFEVEGTDDGQLLCLGGVAIDSTGRVYVADNTNNRIQVFTSEGELLSMFGKKGAGRGELNWPFGIAVDASGLVYVSEYDNDRVSVFTSEGKFVTSFGSKGREPGQFDTPRGLAVDSSGVVYVCDHNCVQIF